MELLIVEDDPTLAPVMLRELGHAGYRCDVAPNGRVGLESARRQKYDAILLDLGLPEVPGLELLESIRQSDIQTPVIILSAMGAVDERIAGLNAGADDYVAKPFSMDELKARLTAVLRRAAHRPAATIEVGALKLDLTTRRVSRGGKEVELTPTEFSLLEFLMRYHGQVVTRAMLCERLWEADWEGSTNVIEVHINRLRSKVDKGFDGPLIHTVRGKGYSLRMS